MQPWGSMRTLDKLRAQKVTVCPSNAQSGRITLSVESQLLAVLLSCQKQSKPLRVEYLVDLGQNY